MKTLNDAIESAQSGNCEQALEIYGSLIDSDREKINALGHRAWLLKSLGRYEEALADYHELVTLAPDNREVAYQRLDTICRMGQPREAIQGILEMIKVDPYDKQAARFLASFQDAMSAVTYEPVASLPTLDVQPTIAINPVIQAIEQDINSYPATAYPEIGRMLYTLAKLIRPGLTIETGCFIGYSTLCMAQALEETGSGHIHSFDLFPPNDAFTSPILGQCKNRLEASRGHIEQAGLSHRITLHQGDSSTGITSLLSNIATTPCVDLAFLDGDHTTDGCKKDFYAIDPYLRDGGFILLHDTVPKYCGWAGPRQLMDDLIEKSNGTYQAINFPSPEGFGLGLLQKSGGGAVAPWRTTFTQTMTDLLYQMRHRR